MQVLMLKLNRTIKKGGETLKHTIDWQNPQTLHDISSQCEYSDGELTCFHRFGKDYRLHHTAKYPIYASRTAPNRFYHYGGKFGNGFVRFMPIPGQRGSLCHIEYWIRQGET